jgi:hypothetical protein
LRVFNDRTIAVTSSIVDTSELHKPTADTSINPQIHNKYFDLIKKHAEANMNL